jgi:hypothetical protein
MIMSLIAAGHAAGTEAHIHEVLQTDPPLIGQAPRFAREVTLPVPDGFEWPVFDCFVLYSHTCNYRNCWGELGLRAVSVADRRTILEPPPECMHVIGSVADFVDVYPHPMPVVDAHPHCDPANNASHTTWPAKIADGSMLAALMEIVWILALGDRVGVEQPPTAHRFTLGPPTFKFNAQDCDEDKYKDVWYWTRHLPSIAPIRTRPKELRHAYSSTVHASDRERRMLRRSTSYRPVAAHLTVAWDPRHLPPTGDSPRRASALHPSFVQHRLDVRHNFTIFAASYAPIVTRDDVDAADVRLIVIVPVAYCTGIVVHAPMAGMFGVIASSKTQPLLDQARTAAKCLSGASDPFLAGYTRDASSHAIFALPVTETPQTVLSDKAALAAACAAGARSAWCSAAAIADAPMYEYALMALARIRAMKEPMVDSGLRIGAWQHAVPTVPHRANTAWLSKMKSDGSRLQWAQFIEAERVRGTEIRAALRAADNGDGALVQWAENVVTAADFMHELLPPAQGLPDFSHDVLRLTELPQPPPPIGTEWLHSVPPQQVPPGLDEVEWWEVHTKWARDKLVAALNATAARGFETFSGGEPETPVPQHVIIGPGGFMLRAHADGIGDYCMNIVVLQLNEASGKLRPMDFQAAYAEHRNIGVIIAAISRVLGPDATDHELLCFLAEGVRFKAYVPPDQRYMHNLVSLDTRGAPAAATALDLVKQGRVVCMRLVKRGELISPDGRCPFHFTPGEATGSGGADKKDDPTKSRMVQNYTAPNGSVDKPVRVRNHPNVADGAHVLDQNAASGDKVKGPRRASSTRPSRSRSPSPAPRLGRADGAPVGAVWAEHFTDVRRRSDNSDAANPFKPCGKPDRESRKQSLAAMTHWYEKPDLTADEVVRGFPSLLVDRDYRSYHGHTLVAAVRRFARMVIASRSFTFYADSPDEICHRFLIALWVTQLAEEGIYSRVPHPFPDPELKMRPRDTYCALAVLSHLALLGGTYLAGATDDVSGMFWQFWRHPSEYHLGMFFMVLPFEETIVVDGKETKVTVLYLCALYWKVMLMGGRPASKIACRWAEPWLRVWRARMVPIVNAWLPKQTPALQTALEERRLVLGEQHATPFWADLFTDDFQFHFISPELMAPGMAAWHDHNVDGGVEMCKIAKKGAGTVIDAIGARNVLNGGFGVLTQTKRLRVITDCQLALTGQLSRERYEANNGLIVHADDIMNLAPGSLNGIWRPLKVPGFKEDVVSLTTDAHTRYAAIIEQMASRAGASFLCAIEDALAEERAHPEAPRLHIASDACTDAARPGVFGAAQGPYYLFELDAEWLRRSINVLEGIGRGLNHIVLASAHPDIGIVNECDNDSAAVSGLHRARSQDIQSVQEALEESNTYQETSLRSWEVQVQGIGNELSDAGSRGKWDVLFAVAASIGLRMRRLYLGRYPEAIAFLERVLATTTARECTHPDPPHFTCSTCSTSISAIQRALTLTERCLGICPACSAKDGPSACEQDEWFSDDDVEDEGEIRCDVCGHRLGPVAFTCTCPPPPPPPPPAAPPMPLELAMRLHGGGDSDDDVSTSPVLYRARAHSTPRQPPQPASARSSRSSAAEHGINRLSWGARGMVASAAGAAVSSAASPLLFSAPSPQQPVAAPRVVSNDSPPVLFAAPCPPPVPPEQRFFTHAPDERPVEQAASAGSRQVPPPMPASAAAARALAMRELEEYLLTDSSAYAIGGGDPAKVQDMVADSLALILDGIPSGTLKADNSGVGWAVRFCIDAETAFLRPMVLTPADHPRERYVFARCVVYHALHAAPRSKTRCGENGEVITDVKPDSSLAPVLAWRRVLRDSGRELIDLKTIRPHLKGLIARYKKAWGQLSLVPVRELPFSQPQLHAINNTLRSSIGAFDKLQWHPAKRGAMGVTFKCGIATGVRANEPTRAFTADGDYPRRSSFVFIGGSDEELPMTPETLRSLKDGALLRGRRGPSKCDRSGMEWGDRDCWFRLDRSNPLNFAAAWVDYELEHPCPPEQRSVWAAFSPDGGKLPWTTAGLQRDFNETLRCAIGVAEAGRRSWHSCRVTIATALSTRRRPDGLIQAIVCWKTLDAMRLYAKTNRHQYADAVEEATQTQIDVTRVGSLPALGPEDVADQLDATLGALDVLDDNDGGGGSGDAGQRPVRAAAQAGSSAQGKAVRQPNKQQRVVAAAQPKKRQRAAAAAAPTAASPPSHGTTTLSDGAVVRMCDDPVVGCAVRVPNTFWNWGSGSTWCEVVGKLHKPHVFANGTRAAAYVISDGVRRDAIKADAVRGLPRRSAIGEPIKKRARG